MSAMLRIAEPWADRIERELGAVPRSFQSVKGALRWYLEQVSRRLGRALTVDGGGCPRAQAEVDQANATYSRIAACLGPRDEADLEHGEPLAYASDPEEARAEAERRVGELARWYVSSAERGCVRLADELKMNSAQCERYVQYTERVLRRRMRARGLVA